MLCSLCDYLFLFLYFISQVLLSFVYWAENSAGEIRLFYGDLVHFVVIFGKVNFLVGCCQCVLCGFFISGLSGLRIEAGYRFFDVIGIEFLDGGALELLTLISLPYHNHPRILLLHHLRLSPYLSQLLLHH